MSEVGVKENCKYWVHGIHNRCNAPAIVIFWGKLFPSDFMGPMCEQHAEGYFVSCGHPYGINHYIKQGWAIFDLRNLTRSE